MLSSHLSRKILRKTNFISCNRCYSDVHSFIKCITCMMADKHHKSFLSSEQIEIIIKTKLKHANFNVLKVDLKRSELMLGFLGDYHFLDIYVKDDRTKEKSYLNFFIKSVSRINESKARMVDDLHLFDKEVNFYRVLKQDIHIPDFRKWSPEFYGFFEKDLVLENMKASGFKIRDNLKTFDLSHCKQAILSLASFHASSFIFEENQKRKFGDEWNIQDNYKSFLDNGGYEIKNDWIKQCMDGGLIALKSLTKYSSLSKEFDEKWGQVWKEAIDVANTTTKIKCVISHRDLWCNNIMFHYDYSGQPDRCIFVDYQAVKCQPPAGDLMILLYLNLERNLLIDNFEQLISFYYGEMKNLLVQKGFKIEELLSESEFNESIEEQRKWALVVCACLLPQMWFDDETVSEIFSDPEQFNDILVKNKGGFIVKMLNEDPRYREKIVNCFEEIVERYIGKE